MSFSDGVQIKGVYAHLDCLLTGIEDLKAAGITGWTVQAPLPRHEIEEAIYEGRPAPVRWWTLTGAVAGLTAGFLLTSLTHAQWPMINPGGKPVVSLPTFAVIMFECTILFGGLATFLGMIVHTGLPSLWLPKVLQDPRVVDDKFSISFTEAPASQRERIAELLKASGAVEVSHGADAIYEVPNA